MSKNDCGGFTSQRKIWKFLGMRKDVYLTYRKILKKTTVSNEHHLTSQKPRLVKYNNLARDKFNISTYAAYI